MKLLLSSADIREIGAAYTLGVFSGVATNPTVVANQQIHTREMATKVIETIEDPVFVQVTGLNEKDILEEATELARIDKKRIIVKVPVTKVGIRSINKLSNEGILTTATAIFSSNEALVAARAGADFLAPYIGRIYDDGGDGEQVVQDIVNLVSSYDLQTQVIAASIRNSRHFYIAWRAGADFSAVPYSIVQKICTNHQVKKAAEQFHEDYVSWKEG